MSRIRRNSETSPLLKLAPEVREKILLYIVGGHFVHVQHSSDAEFGFRNIDSRISDCDAEGWPTTPKGFRHVICQAEISETAAHRESRDGYAEVPKEDSPEYYVQGCELESILLPICIASYLLRRSGIKSGSYYSMIYSPGIALRLKLSPKRKVLTPRFQVPSVTQIALIFWRTEWSNAVESISMCLAHLGNSMKRPIIFYGLLAPSLFVIPQLSPISLLVSI